MSESTAVFP